jgi:hypothetical protein
MEIAVNFFFFFFFFFLKIPICLGEKPYPLRDGTSRAARSRGKL